MSIPLFDLSESFSDPVRFIVDERHTFRYYRYSKSYEYMETFFNALLRAVQGIPISQLPEPSQNTQGILFALNEVQRIFDETPPVARGPRMGNPSFFTFVDKLCQSVEHIHEQLLSTPELKRALKEVAPYFLCCWGHRRRMDYGSGHEVSFLQWLTCLVRLGLISPSDLPNIGLRVIPLYIHICRQIQTIYTLEPAGSRGMWGLDDFNYIPFVVGSAQAEGSDFLPRQLLNTRDAEELSSEWFIADTVVYAQKSRSAPIQEAAPVLWDILTTSQSWRSVKRKTLQLWHDEVIFRYVASQHFLFGKLLPFVAVEALDQNSLAALDQAAQRGLTAPGALTGVGIGVNPAMDHM